MELKIVLFFSIILLIFSAGAVSSADVDYIDLTDSYGIGDVSLDSENSATHSVHSIFKNNVDGIPDMMIPRDYERELMEINSVDDFSDKQDNNDKILPNVSCEATDLDGLNKYIAVMDSKGTNSKNSVRENVSQRYNTIIPKEHSNTLILKNNVSTIKNNLIIKITNGNNITIDGQGHTINLTGSSKHDHYFVVKSGHVTFKHYIRPWVQ